jgi:hypothetical protein
MEHGCKSNLKPKDLGVIGDSLSETWVVKDVFSHEILLHRLVFCPWCGIRLLPAVTPTAPTDTLETIIN